MVMVFLYSSALMSSFVEGWLIEDYAFQNHLPWECIPGEVSGNPSLVKKKRAEMSVVSLCSSPPLQIPRVLCCALCSLADRFYCIQAQIFSLLGCCHRSPGMSGQLQRGLGCNIGGKKTVFIVRIGTANECVHTYTESFCRGIKPCMVLRWKRAECHCF